jgi:hypothetical protein
MYEGEVEEMLCVQANFAPVRLVGAPLLCTLASLAASLL